MNHHYEDITGRIAEKPKWWDEYAVPRYCDFSPDETANIYAREAVLMEIHCQGCGEAFKVCMSVSHMSAILKKTSTLEWAVANDAIHYGDPPNTGCCPAGATMNSVPVRILEFWRKAEKQWEWERVPELEIDFDPDEVTAE